MARLRRRAPRSARSRELRSRERRYGAVVAIATSSPRLGRFDWTNLGCASPRALVLAPVALLRPLVRRRLGRLPVLSVVLALMLWDTIGWSRGAAAARGPGSRRAAGGRRRGARRAPPPAGSAWRLSPASRSARCCAGRAAARAEAALAPRRLPLHGARPWARCSGFAAQEPEGVLLIALAGHRSLAADIGAFVVGTPGRGPKLWPRFSPNKTWSGVLRRPAPPRGLVGCCLRLARRRLAPAPHRPR